MGTGMVPEMSVIFNQLTRLIPPEDFINFSPCEGFKSDCAILASDAIIEFKKRNDDSILFNKSSTTAATNLASSILDRGNMRWFSRNFQSKVVYEAATKDKTARTEIARAVQCFRCHTVHSSQASAHTAPQGLVYTGIRMLPRSFVVFSVRTSVYCKQKLSFSVIFYKSHLL